MAIAEALTETYLSLSEAAQKAQRDAVFSEIQFSLTDFEEELCYQLEESGEELDYDSVLYNRIAAVAEELSA